jgi:quercetin dioxygenase-like cupin family protein
VATIFNENSVSREALGRRAFRQRLLTAARVPRTKILLDRLTVAAGGGLPITVPAASLAWFQVLDGEMLLSGDGEQKLSQSHVVFLPPGYSGALSAERDACMLYGEIPDAARLDPQLTRRPPPLRVVDWTREPVLDSEHDARKRIYLVTPKLAGTAAIKGEMIIYPAGTAAANHHHEGAEHFMYVLRGRGTVYANEQPYPVRQGDVIYYPDRERHYLEAAADQELVFAEFFAPSEFKTVWVDASKVCGWLPTGRDILGRAPVREIKAHSVADAHPEDV